jgi:methyl-accepting chemotaxis protein
MDNAKASWPASVIPPVRIQRHVSFIGRGLQLRFFTLVVGSVVLAVALIGWDIYRTFGADVVQDLMDPGLYRLFHKFGYVLAIKVFLYLLAVAAVAVYLSHKLAGPIYRFEQSSRIVAAGDLTHQLRLRKGDELMNFQNEFNKMIVALRNKVSVDKALVHTISTRIDSLSTGNSLSPQVLDGLKKIHAEIGSIGSGFKV